VAAAVVAVVALAWLIVGTTQDVAMAVMAAPAMGMGLDAAVLASFFLLMIVMMVAMMLPSALPMILAFRGLTRLEGGRPVRPADDVGTALFVLPYFLVWGAFGVLALLGLMSLGLLGPFVGVLAAAPAVVLLAAGAYQFTRPKEVCLSHCESPMSFVMLHWRPGRAGAVRMGLRHSVYCIGCCWLFMLVLFVAGAMSLLWMGIVSILIFVEKVGVRAFPASRAVALVLLALGGIVVAHALLG
jgi:predicted metal-binding membrane protein